MGSSRLKPGPSNKESGNAERKLDKKLCFYAKVRDTVVSLAAKKSISKKRRLRSRQKKLKAYDLSTLSEFLPEFNSPKQLTDAAKPKKLNSKSRKKLVEKESQQLQAVLNHPAFKSDPLAAIHQHILNTQPAPVTHHDKRSGKTKKDKAKRKNSKVSSGTQSMEI